MNLITYFLLEKRAFHVNRHQKSHMIVFTEVIQIVIASEVKQSKLLFFGLPRRAFSPPRNDEKKLM